MLEVIPRRKSSVASRALDGEAVLVHAEQKKVLVLNGVGARLWDLADGQHTLADMARVIAGEYEVSLVKAESDALAFCRDLEGRGLLTLDS
ncbi:MAG: PqqD family protein [Nitrososphaerales archaeon]